MTQNELFDDALSTACDPATCPPTAFLPQLETIANLSLNAYCTALYAHLSELPIRREITGFIEKVARAGGRAEAERIAHDRSDADVFAVLKAAGKVWKEVHRIMGFLRFSPDKEGTYTARCSPDHFVLPVLADHFSLRFGETPWLIVDEKRKVCLMRKAGGEVQLVPVDPSPTVVSSTAPDVWEDLWRLYHRSVNNESRTNLALQRQFIPERYQKYMNEL